MVDLRAVAGPAAPERRGASSRVGPAVKVLRRWAGTVADMQQVRARVGGVVLLVTALLATVLVDSGLLDAGPAEPGSLLLGAVGALLLVWGVGHPAVVATAAVGTPAVAARERRRAIARRAVPRQRDPDAAGRTRSRAPSETPPAV